MNERTKKKRRDTERSRSVKRGSTNKKGKGKGKKSGMEITLNDDEGLPSTSTWKSNDHKRRSKQLKKAHEKKSYRYDEALDVKNDRASALFSILNDIEVEKESRKKKAKIEKGKSLLGDELQAVEDDAMLDTLVQHYDSKKKGCETSAEIDRTFHMVMYDGDSDQEVNLNSHEVTMNKHAALETPEDVSGLTVFTLSDLVARFVYPIYLSSPVHLTLSQTHVTLSPYSSNRL